MGEGMEQDAGRSDDILDALVTIRTVEQRSGLNFLRELSQADQDALETVTFDTWVGEWIGG